MRIKQEILSILEKIKYFNRTLSLLTFIIKN